MENRRSGRPDLLPLLFGHWPFFCGCAFVAIGGIAVFCFFVLELDLFHGGAAPKPGTAEFANSRSSTTVLSIFFAVIGGIMAVHGFLRCQHLARYGIIVAGTVTKFHSIRHAMSGSSDVSYSYCVDDKGYEGKVTVSSIELDKFQENPQIFLLVDPARPDSHVRLIGYKVKNPQPEEGV